MKQATIASQLEELKQRFQTDELRWQEELCFVDDGYSGATLVRPALERLRDLAYSGGIDRLYVLDPTRLARGYALQAVLMEEFSRCGVEVEFLNHHVGDTPEEQLLLQMQGAIAEFERAKITERVRRGKRHAARCGAVSALSHAPYGYRYITKQEGDGQAAYQVILEEARVVQQMFQWIGRDRLTIRGVIRRLQEQGIPTRTGKTRWSTSTVRAVLKNPAYKGTAAFGKRRVGPRRPGPRIYHGQQPQRDYSLYWTDPQDWSLIAVPAILDEGLFAAVQEQLQENAKRQRQRREGAKTLLQGLVVCKGCGYGYSLRKASGSNKYSYYRCNGGDRQRFGGQRVCHNKAVRADLLEAAVWEDVTSLLREPRRVLEEYERRLKPKAKDSCGTQLTREIQNLQRGISRLIDGYEAGLLTKGEFEPRIQRARDRLARLEADAEVQRQQRDERLEFQLAVGNFEEFTGRLEERLENPDWSTQREILSLLVKRIEVDEHDVRVIYKVSPLPFVPSPARGKLQHCARRLSVDFG